MVVSDSAGSVTSQPANLTILLSFQEWLNLYFGGPGNNLDHECAGLLRAAVPAKRAMPLAAAQPAATDPYAPDADPDGDGVPNLLEYVFGTNPVAGMSSQDAAKMPKLTTEAIDGTVYAVFSFNMSGHATANLILRVVLT